jgi:hypothetical protein
MDRLERVKRHFNIGCSIGGRLFFSLNPIENLPLGEDYGYQIETLNKQRRELFQKIVSDLSKFEEGELTENFSFDGKPISESAELWISKYKQEVVTLFGRLNNWYLAPLFQTRDLADFEYWVRADYLSIDELVWLSVGLEPNQTFIDAINPLNSNGSMLSTDKTAQFIRRHKELIRRKFDPQDLNEKPEFDEVKNWIDRVDLKVHSDFYSLLEKRVAFFQAGIGSEEIFGIRAKAVKKRPDQREIDKIAQLFAAMAVDQLGYVPDASRSPVPKEITDIAASMGLTISDDTVRKYLKLGSRFISNDWKPN